MKLFSKPSRPPAKELLRDQITSEAVTKTIQTQVSRTAREVAYRLPSLVDASTKWLDQYEKGRFSVHVDTSDLTPQVEKLDQALGKTFEEMKQWWEEQVPLRRFVTQEEVAATALFLVSDESSGITAQQLCVSGGMEVM